MPLITPDTDGAAADRCSAEDFIILGVRLRNSVVIIALTLTIEFSARRSKVRACGVPQILLSQSAKPIVHLPRSIVSQGGSSVPQPACPERYIIDLSEKTKLRPYVASPLIHPPVMMASLATSDIHRNRSRPNFIPPYQRLTTTTRFQTSMIWRRWSKRPPAAVSPSSS